MTLNTHPWAVYLQVDTLEGSDIRKNSVQAMIKLDWAALFLILLWLHSQLSENSKTSSCAISPYREQRS